MGYKYIGDAKLGVSLTIDTPKPLDARSVVDNFTELYSISADTAYLGMRVSNLEDGNIYMLIDKSKINEKEGWKTSTAELPELPASTEIITCTEAEYKVLEENTNDDFTPKDESKPCLNPDTYYYIYEDSLSPETQSQEYLNRAWGQNIEDTLSTKATQDAVIEIKKDIAAIEQDIIDNYSTKKEVTDITGGIVDTMVNDYATKELLTSTISDTISNTISDYYTKTEIDNVFVTKDVLTGGSDDGDSEYIFVTNTQLNEYKNEISEELDKTLKVENDGSLKNLTVETITSSQENLNIETNQLYINSNLVALHSDIPVIEVLGQSEYENLENKQENVYYYTYQDSEEKGWVTNDQLTDFYRKSEVDLLLAELSNELKQLQEQINLLQNPEEEV